MQWMIDSTDEEEARNESRNEAMKNTRIGDKGVKWASVKGARGKEMVGETGEGNEERDDDLM